MRSLLRQIRGARGILSGADFRRLCISQVFGGMGEWLATLALIALVWERTHSALASGVILAFRILPAALIGSMLGSLVDRMDRRRVLVATTAGRAAVYGALPVVGGIAPILALALVAEIASLTYVAARDATLPRLVPPDKLSAANALSMAASYGGMPVGTALFTVMTVVMPGAEAFGAQAALFLAGALLAVATLMLGRMQAAACGTKAAAISGAAPPALSKKQIRRDGYRALRATFRNDRLLRRVAIGGAIASAGGGAIMTLGLAYVRGTLKAGPSAYTALLGAFAVGAAAGVIAVQRNRTRLPTVFRAGVALMGVILLGSALYPSKAMGYGLGFVFGGAFIASFLGGITILQERVHDSIRGRAFALAHSGLRVGAVAIGVLAAWGAKMLGTKQHLYAGMRLDGTQVVLALTGLVIFFAAAFVIRVKHLPARVEAPAG